MKAIWLALWLFNVVMYYGTEHLTFFIGMWGSLIMLALTSERRA